MCVYRNTFRHNETDRFQHKNNGDISTSLSLDRKSFRQKITKDILELKHTIEQMDLTDIQRKLHPTDKEYTFFSLVRGTSGMDHVSDHKSPFSKLKRLKSYHASSQAIKEQN